MSVRKQSKEATPIEQAIADSKAAEAPANPAPSDTVEPTVTGGTAVVVQEPTRLPTTESVPQHFSQVSGIDSLDREDFAIPRVKLVTSLSPEYVKRGENKSIQADKFYHTVTQECFSEDMRIAILQNFKSAALWVPNKRDGGNGVLARANNLRDWDVPNRVFEVAPRKDDPSYIVKWHLGNNVAQSYCEFKGPDGKWMKHHGLDKWGSSDPMNPNSSPALQVTYNMLVFLLDYPELSPSLFLLSRSRIKKVKTVNTVIKMMCEPKRLPSWHVGFSVKPTTDENKANGNVFPSVNFSSLGYIGKTNDTQKYLELLPQIEQAASAFTLDTLRTEADRAAESELSETEDADADTGAIKY